MSKVTIVMYHYVRELLDSRYPEIKGLNTSLFKKQIEYLKDRYVFVSMEEIIESLNTNSKLPKNAVHLSFDDGYVDHYTNVLPVLIDYGINGSFYPPVRTVKDNVVLDVNKIHFILASEDNKQEIVNAIYGQLDVYREKYQLKSNEYYYEKLAIASRYDTADVIFIKRILQVELKEELRSLITDILFKKYVELSEDAFAKELYMDVNQLKVMKKMGMHIGSHGDSHYWFDSLSKADQDIEISKSLEFLEEINGDTKNWAMCYPYGAYNSDTIELLKKYNCQLALTTKVGTATVSHTNRYTLERIDTNDVTKMMEKEGCI